MANGFKDHRKLRVNWRQQTNALIELIGWISPALGRKTGFSEMRDQNSRHRSTTGLSANRTLLPLS
jgi:hypothetical protein